MYSFCFCILEYLIFKFTSKITQVCRTVLLWVIKQRRVVILTDVSGQIIDSIFMVKEPQKCM